MDSASRAVVLTQQGFLWFGVCQGDDWRNKARRGDILDDEEKAYLGVGAGGAGADDYDDDF
jgi:hypothetical protein